MSVSNTDLSALSNGETIHALNLAYVTSLAPLYLSPANPGNGSTITVGEFVGTDAAINFDNTDTISVVNQTLDQITLQLDPAGIFQSGGKVTFQVVGDNPLGGGQHLYLLYDPNYQTDQPGAPSAYELLSTSTAFTNTQNAAFSPAPAFTVEIPTVSGLSAANAVATGAQGVIVAVKDTAANVVANLDALATLAANGQLASISLTDSGTPSLAISATQLAADASALAKISGPFIVTVNDTTATAVAGFDLGPVAGDNESATVVGNSATLTNTGTFVVGDLAVGSLSIQNGGSVVTALGGSTGGTAAIITNTTSAAGSSVNLTGTGSGWSVSGSLVVGKAGLGSLILGAGATVTAASLDAGVAAGTSGNITASGSNALLSVTGNVSLGDAGTSVDSVANGASLHVGGNLNIGQTAGDSGNLDIENAALTVTGNLNLGAGGPGVLTVGPTARVSVGGGIVGGANSVVNEFASIDPNFDDGAVTNVKSSLTQDYLAYVDGGASFSISQGVSFVLETPSMYGSALLSIGARSDTQGATLVLNTGSVSADTTVMFNNKLDTLVIGNNALGTIDLQTSDTAPATLVANPNLGVPSIGSFYATIGSFKAGDEIVVDTAQAATFSLSGSIVSVLAGTTSLGSLTFDSTTAASAAYNTAGGLVDQILPCFVEGTRIATLDGELPVERLVAGDRVRTKFVHDAPIKWIGQRRIDCRRHAHPAAVLPVRISRDAFGPGLPARDLRLSPDHALYFADIDGGVLIPVKLLINGTTVTREMAVTIRYYHIELADHDVLFAEGLPVESYLETGQRSAFANGGEVMMVHPDFSAMTREGRGCAPLVLAGPCLEAARNFLRIHARAIAAA